MARVALADEEGVVEVHLAKELTVRCHGHFPTNATCDGSGCGVPRPCGQTRSPRSNGSARSRPCSAIDLQQPWQVRSPRRLHRFLSRADAAPLSRASRCYATGQLCLPPSSSSVADRMLRRAAENGSWITLSFFIERVHLPSSSVRAVLPPTRNASADEASCSRGSLHSLKHPEARRGTD